MNGLALCAGIGGLELGVKIACPEYRTVCYVEGEAFSAAHAVEKMEQGILDKAPIWSNVRTFDGKPWRGKIHIITAGYPCQPFSLAGKRAGRDDPRHLWPGIARIIGEVEPLVCFFENVAGHIKLGYADVERDLRNLGYDVTCGIFSAAEIGAPHLRERLFILAYNGSRIDKGRERFRTANRYEKTNRPLRCSETVAYTKGERCREARADSERRSIRYTSASATLGNADKQGSQGRKRSERKHAYQLPTWPPGPSQRDEWQRIIEIAPHLEPAVCKVANGIPDRVDRLRALGNSVVPMVAAAAFSTLWARMNE